MQIQYNSIGKVIGTEICQFSGHDDLQISHICIFKNCENNRIGCIKCLEAHDHQLETKYHYIKLKNFKKYIQQKVNNQLEKYNFSEELIKELKKFDQKSEVIKKTIDSIQATQKTHLKLFKLAKQRFLPPQQLSKQTLQQLIEMDGELIRKQYQQNNDLLSQLHQSGIQWCVKQKKQELQNEQFVMEEKYLKKHTFNIQKDGNFLRLKVSPNGAYLAYQRNCELKIYKINTNQVILTNRMNYHYFNITFSEDSQFYFYFDARFIYFQAIKNSQKRIFGKVRIRAQIIFPFNQQDILISNKNDNQLSILRHQNRSIRQINMHGQSKNVSIFQAINRFIEFEYDNQNHVIICVKENEIQFYDHNKSSLIFEKDIYEIDINQVKLLKETNCLICGSEEIHYLYLINYQKKDLYLLNKFQSECKQSLNTIFHFRYPIIMIESGIIILDENFKEIQFIEFTQQLPLLLREMNSVLVCTKFKIQLIKYYETIDYGQQEIIN